ncbi:MAG: hypothetical protein HF962_08245 [Sulfurovum sp.]|nr:hypothetical protein [Sulfurovum sp.]
MKKIFILISMTTTLFASSLQWETSFYQAVKKYFQKTWITPKVYFIAPDKKPLEEIIGYVNEEFLFWRVDSAEREAKKIGANK